MQRVARQMQNYDIRVISEETGISVKELNRLNQDLWYHGTTIESAEDIKKNGVIANYNIGSELDFGPGFYLTDTYQRAESYISRNPVFTPDGEVVQRTEWAVIEFAFNPFELLFMEKQPYVYKNYSKHNDEFANFVFDNRIKNMNHENPHNYDIIWGVMSDNNPDKVIMDYRQGEISYMEVIGLLQKPNSMRQLFIGNQSICDMLMIKNIYIKEGNENA